MNDLITRATITPADVTAIPEQVIALAMQLAHAVEALPGLGVLVQFSSDKPVNGPLPLVLAGIAPADQLPHALVCLTALAGAVNLDLNKLAAAGECPCPTCQARHAASEKAPQA